MEQESSLEIVRLIVKRNFDGTATDHGSKDSNELLDKLSLLTHCRLDRENLHSVPLLDFLPCLTNLYLQCNFIEDMSNFSSLPKLRFLMLAGNRISRVSGIKNLKNLGFLDLSKNCIRFLDFAEIPKSVVIFNISDNPCYESEHFYDDVINNLPNLKSLDGGILKSEDSTSGSDEESDDDGDTTGVAEPLQKNELGMSSERNAASSDSLDALRSEMGRSLDGISIAMSEKEKELHQEFDEFASISALIPSTNGDNSLLSDKEISALEKEVAGITVLKPLNVSKRLTPRPPNGSKGKVKARYRPSSGGTTTTRIRTPGARPFNRVVK